MIAALRSTVALTAKELQHHALALFFIAGWSLLMVPFALATALSNGGTSFAAAGTGLAYYYGPVAVLLIVRRLVIQEYEDGTIRFLDALPAPAWLQFSVKAVVGWLASVGLVCAISAPLLLFASLREFITVFWFLQLLFAIGLYTTGWLTLTFAIAHTGRFRHWIWMILFLLMATWFEGDWQLYTWHAALGTNADATRHAIPWTGFATTAAWSLGLGSIAAFLAIFRGGALPAVAFRSASTRERVTGTSLVLALYLMVEVYPETGAGTLEGWDSLPQPEAQIRAIGAVGAWPEAAREALDALEAIAPLDPPSQVVLAADYSRLSWGDPGPRVRWKLWDRDEVLIRVREEPTQADRARILDAVIDQRSAGMAQYALDRGFAADGLGLFAVEDPDDRRLAERRAALALRQGLVEADLADWASVRAKVGPDLAAGVGAIGLTVVEPQALGPWIAESLLRVLPEAARSGRALGRVRDVAGISFEAHRAAWWKALERAADARADEIASIGQWQATVGAASEPRSNLDLTWSIEGAPARELELVARPADPVRGRPTPLEPAYSELHLDLTASDGSTPTWFAADDRVLVHLRRWDFRVGGYLTSGETVVNP